MVLTGSSLRLTRCHLLLACLLLGLVLVTAFAPFSWYWLAIPVLGFVLAVWHQATPGKATAAQQDIGFFLAGSGGNQVRWITAVSWR